MENIKLEDLRLFIEPSNILFEPKVVGLDKNDKAFEISHYSGKIIPIEGECPIKEDWAVCSLEKAKEIQKHFTFSNELKEYIKRSAEKAFREHNQVFGKDFRFYINDIDIVYAIDENKTEYICCLDFMKVLDDDRFIDPMWGGISQNEVMKYIKQ